MTKILAALGLCLTFFVSQAQAHTNLPPGARSWSSRLIDRCMQALSSNRGTVNDPIGISNGVSESDKLYFNSSVGPQSYREYLPAGQKDNTVYLMIHGMGNDMDSNREFLQQAPLHGHEMISAGLNGSDLELLKKEDQNGGIRSTDRFANSVRGITELMLYKRAKSPGMRVVIVGHSMGAAIGLIVAKNLKAAGIDVALVYGAGFVNYEVAVSGVMGKAGVLRALATGRMGSLKMPFNTFIMNYLRKRFIENREREGMDASAETVEFLAKGAMGYTNDMSEDVKVVVDGKEKVEIQLKYNLLAHEINGKYADKFGVIEAKKLLARMQVPILVLAGEKDTVAPLDDLKVAAQELSAFGIPTELKILEGEGSDHEFFGKRAVDSYGACENFVDREFSEQHQRRLKAVAQ